HVVFFFSSRRRHTRSKRDWSSDVCSSDLHVRTVPTPASAGAQEILDTIAEAAAAVIAEPGRDAAVSEWRIGVGAAGVIDPVTGTVVSATDSLSGWAGTRLVAELEARTQLRARPVNDVRAPAPA